MKTEEIIEKGFSILFTRCNYFICINFAIFSIFLVEKFGSSEKGCIFALAFGNEASRQGQRLVKESKNKKEFIERFT